MAVSLNVGIERISYQAQNAEQKSDFPRRKVYLPINASIPSHIEEVFDLYTSTRMLESMVAPRIPNKQVIVPADYARLFHEIQTVGNKHTPSNDHEGQAVAAAQALFSTMTEDFQSFNIGRSALIQG